MNGTDLQTGAALCWLTGSDDFLLALMRVLEGNGVLGALG
jgi:hypothetical protein